MKSPVSLKLPISMAGCSDGPCIPYIEIDSVTKSRVSSSAPMMPSRKTPTVTTNPAPIAISPPTSVTPPPTATDGELSAVDAIVTCSSSATDDMLDTVDECVGCVNQIALQQDFEDSLVDLPLLSQPSLPESPSDDDNFDKIPNLRKKEHGSLFYNNDSASLIQEEDVPTGADMNLLNWCGGGYNGH